MMDAVEYVKQRKRMCNYYGNCGDCPAGNYEWCSSLNGIPKMVPIVEQWAKEHPVKTRQSEFLKMFPNASVGYNGTLVICPSQADTKAVAECVRSERNCDKCKHNFWLKEIE